MLSQSGYSLFATTGTKAETRVCQPLDGESSTGTACRPLLPGLDRRSVLCPSRTGPHRIGRPRRLRGGRRLQRDRVRRAARPCGAAQGHGTRPGPTNRCRAGHRTLAMGTQYDGSAGDAEGIRGAAGVGRCLERDDVRSGHPARPDAGNHARRHRRVRTRTDPGAYPLRYRRSQGARQAPGPPAWTAAEIRSARAAGARPCRKGAQLSLDRARGGAEQEYRGRDRQTSSRHGGSDYMTATLHLVTRMLGPGLLCSSAHDPGGKSCRSL
jgi:hypothetical protein